MAKTLVEKEICDACGADVRADSLFCYNCGGAVSESLPETAANPNERDEAGTKRQAKRGGAKKDLKTTQLKPETLENAGSRPIARPSVEPLPEKIEDRPVEKPTVEPDTKLRSAANMRRKPKSFQKKTVEVVWEEPENSPNKWFPLVAIVLILVVVGIYYLAMYLK